MFMALPLLIAALRPLNLQKTISDISERGYVFVQTPEAPLKRAPFWPKVANIFLPRDDRPPKPKVQKTTHDLKRRSLVFIQPDAISPDHKKRTFVSFQDPNQSEKRRSLDMKRRSLVFFQPAEVALQRPLTQAAFWPVIASVFKPRDVVISEFGSCSFGLQNQKLPVDSFQSAAVWASIGWAGGAIVGAAFAAKEQGRRSFLLTGDGSYMETIQDLGTLIRYGLTPTIFLINNSGYTIERHSESFGRTTCKAHCVAVREPEKVNAQDYPHDGLSCWSRHSMMSQRGTGSSLSSSWVRHPQPLPRTE
jgi:hypothetical protein